MSCLDVLNVMLRLGLGKKWGVSVRCQARFPCGPMGTKLGTGDPYEEVIGGHQEVILGHSQVKGGWTGGACKLGGR